jgi:hypothetical protein
LLSGKAKEATPGAWEDITPDNWPTMEALKRKYAGRCRWQGSWCRKEVQDQLNEPGVNFICLSIDSPGVDGTAPWLA